MEKDTAGQKSRIPRYKEDAPKIARNLAFQEAIRHYDNSYLATSRIEEDDPLYLPAVACQDACYDALCKVVDAHTARQISLALGEQPVRTEQAEKAPPGPERIPIPMPCIGGEEWIEGVIEQLLHASESHRANEFTHPDLHLVQAQRVEAARSALIWALETACLEHTAFCLGIYIDNQQAVVSSA